MKKLAKWELAEIEKVKAMSNDELFAYAIEAVSEMYTDNSTNADSFRGELGKRMLRRRLFEAGFLQTPAEPV